MFKSFNSEKLNEIMNELLNSMDNSKNKAFQFHEFIFKKIVEVEKNLEETNIKMRDLSMEIIKTENQSKLYREKLIRITKSLAKDLEKYQILYQETYSITDNLLVRKNILEVEYKNLFTYRDSLERELINLKEVLVDTDYLLNSINTSFKYLNNDLSEVSHHLNEKEVILFKIIEAGENEKKSIAREIHDGPAQTLAYLSLEIQLLKTLINNNKSKETNEKISDIEKYIQDTLDETRRIIYDLRPMSLDDLGLIPTLQNYINEFNQKKDMKVSLKVLDKDNLHREIPSALGISVYRIVQEALNNIYKYAETNIANVNIDILGHSLILKVVDNGRGFDVRKVFKNVKTNRNFGLLGMKERVDLLNGEFKIKSSINKGTTIYISLPLDFTNK